MKEPFNEVLIDLWADLSQPEILWQLGTLALCLLLARQLSLWIRLPQAEASGVWKLGVGGLKRILFPLLALVLVLIGRALLQRWHHVNLLHVAVPLLGSLALIGTPLFAGFYSKDSIIEAVHATQLPAAGFANFAVLAGVFVTAFYSFRMYFLVFHGKERFDQNPDAHHDDHHGHDNHWDECTLTDHVPHADHTHEHGENCGHPAVPHGDHVDNVHDGHRHFRHDDHWCEH